MQQTIKIGPITYTVVKKDGLTSLDKSAKLDGHIVFSECQIKVEQSLSPQAERQVIWHEVLHGIITQAGREHNEELIDVLAYGIMDVLQANPWLAETVSGETPN